MPAFLSVPAPCRLFPFELAQAVFFLAAGPSKPRPSGEIRRPDRPVWFKWCAPDAMTS